MTAPGTTASRAPLVVQDLTRAAFVSRVTIPLAFETDSRWRPPVRCPCDRLRVCETYSP